LTIPPIDFQQIVAEGGADSHVNAGHTDYLMLSLRAKVKW